MSNPIFESDRYRRDLPEARALEERLRFTYDKTQAKLFADAAGLDTTQINLEGPPSAFWAAILDFAAPRHEIEILLNTIEAQLLPPPKDGAIRLAITRVRQITDATGSLSPMRLLLSGDRPFLGRPKLRDFLPALRNWNKTSAILVVRGDADSGRTETQIFLDDGRDGAVEKFVLLDEQLTIESTMRAIWKEAGVPGTSPTISKEEALTTESALLIDFWTDVKAALEANGRRLWVLFDDLDKGPGRVTVRMLAEVLAIRLKDVTYQKRIRLVMLGYPEPQLPTKVKATLVLEDTTDTLAAADVKAFLDFCMKKANKNFDEKELTTKADEICQLARAKVTGELPYLEALNSELVTWYQTL